MSETIELYQALNIGQVVDIARVRKGGSSLPGFTVTRVPDGVIYRHKETNKSMGIFVSFFDLEAVELPECIAGPPEGTPGEDGTLSITSELLADLEAGHLPTFQEEVANWQAETFPESHVWSMVSHLKKEIEELEKTALREGFKEEVADCFLLLLGIATLEGFDLLKAGEAKLEINRGRTWGEADADGVVEHTEPGYVAEEDPGIRESHTALDGSEKGPGAGGIQGEPMSGAGDVEPSEGPCPK